MSKDREPITAEDGNANDDRKRSLMHVTLKTGVKIQSYLFGVCNSIKLERNVHTTNEKHYVVLIREWGNEQVSDAKECFVIN